jgi:hypothetical protein
MGGARHPKPYVEGKRKQMTIAWKRRVQAKLDENAKAGIKPSTVADLARMLRRGKGADKAGLYRALDPESDQTASADVDEICHMLGVGPPLVESDEDEELQGDLEVIRSLSPDARRELMVIARRMPRKI